MKVTIPKPFSIAIDDLGWMNGAREDNHRYGPSRLGIERKMSIADYEAVANLGKKVGVRLQSLFILGEMDRENFLGQFPHTTHMQEHWNNTPLISDLQVEIMGFVKQSSAHLEFGLHGVGHEFWPESNKRRRAEWYNTEDNHPWPEEDLRDHMNCFVRIMNQYGLSKENGHSFPQSFVPCAYSYYWNPNGDYSLGSILNDYGVRYANTDFQIIPECNPPSGDDSGGFDHKVHVLNRYNYGNLWDEVSKLPSVPLLDQPTSYIETHWPNLLAQDVSLQSKVTDDWVEYYNEVKRSEDRYVAKNTAQHHAQWLFCKHTLLTEESEGKWIIDNSNMPSEALKHTLSSNMVIQIKLNQDEHITLARLNNGYISGYFEEEGYAYLYLFGLHQKKYELTFEIGHEKLKDVIWHDGTSNINKIEFLNDRVNIELDLYGTQVIRFLSTRKPERITSNKSESIKVIGWEMNIETLDIELRANDIQGEQCIVSVIY